MVTAERTSRGQAQNRFYVGPLANSAIRFKWTLARDQLVMQTSKG